MLVGFSFNRAVFSGLRACFFTLFVFARVAVCKCSEEHSLGLNSDSFASLDISTPEYVSASKIF